MNYDEYDYNDQTTINTLKSITTRMRKDPCYCCERITDCMECPYHK